MSELTDSVNSAIIDALGRVGEGLFIVDANYRVSFMNSVMVGWFGDQTGRICYRSIANRSDPCSYCQLKQVVEGGRIAHYHPLIADGRSFEIVASPISDGAGGIAKLELIRDTTARRAAEHALDQRLRYEKVLAKVSRELLVGREADPLPNALRHLLDGVQVGRVYIFENFSDAVHGVCTSLTHEVCAPGVASELHNPLLQQVPYREGFLRWQQELGAGRPIHGQVSEFPESERGILESQGILSILLLPVMVAGRWQGFIGFDEVVAERAWDVDDVRLLQTAAELIGAYLERKAAEQRIHSLAFFDPLTQLPNRRLLLDRLEHALAASARHRSYGALLFIDLDEFKKLNDSHGHDCGDHLLTQVARRLLEHVREGDTVARAGGDEFMAIMEDLGADAEAAATRAEAVADKIRKALLRPYLLKGREYSGSSGIGITLFLGHEHSVQELLKRAVSALYQAKAGGYAALRFFDPAMQAALDARSALEADLRRALPRQQLQLYYQAQIDQARIGSSRRIRGAEVLLRWLHPQRGLVPPDAIIPLAEETGLIVPIGHWVLETACAQLKAWADDPDRCQLQLSVNVSARQFRHVDFIDQVCAILDHTGADPRRLKLELTESAVLDDVDDTSAKMQALKALGVDLSLDDFGTGYSSLAYLKRLPLDQLKIDRSFVGDIVTDANDAAIVQTIVGMAANLGLDIIAEGVETEAQMAMLQRMGCHAFQGYFFSRPVPLAEFERLTRPLAALS